MLRAQRFDTNSLELVGEVFSVAADVRFDALTANVLLSASQNGILAYQMGEQAGLSWLIWFDRDGRQLDSIGEPGNYYRPRLSHDGRRTITV